VAELADKIVEISPALPQLVVQATIVPKDTTDNAILAAVEGLTKQLSELAVYTSRQ